MIQKNTPICDMKTPAGIGKIDEVVNGLKYYSVLTAALKTGIFDWLDENGPSDKEVITSSLEFNGMFTRCFLATLEDMGFISEEKGMFSNTELTENFLISKSPFYQGDLILSHKEGSSKWNDLAGNIKNQNERIAGFEEGPSQGHINSIAQRGIRGEFQTIVSRIANWDKFSQSKKALDIGGGHGLYCVALCQKNPDLKAVVFDKPHIVPVALDYVEKYGMKNQISVVAGDMTKAIPHDDYDIIMMSHLLYKFRNDLPCIIKKVSESMKDGGLLVLNHWFCSTGCLPETGHAINDLEKSLISFGHPLCHPDEFAKVLNTNGFEVIESSMVPTAYGNSTLHLAVFNKSAKKSSEDTNDENSCCKCR
ncbi:MAG: methyltransferase [Methanogenium sp.]